MQNFSEIQALMKSDLEMTDDILINRLNSNVELINQMSHYIINSAESVLDHYFYYCAQELQAIVEKIITQWL